MIFDSVSFVMTNTCSAACDMCCFSCSPQKKDQLDKELVKDYILQASKLGMTKRVAFTGGEAIIYFDNLKECMEYANSLGIPSTLVTNCFWAKNYDEGYKKLKELKEAGLVAMTYSVDKFHQQYVPYDSVKNAIMIANSLGIQITINLMDLKDGKSVYDSLEALRPYIYHNEVMMHPCFPAGEARNHIKEDQYIYECSADSALCPFDKSITVLYDGTMMICCSQFSHEIDAVKVGKFGETSLEQAIKNFNDNDIIYVLLSNGFGWYTDLARSLGKEIKEKYVICCHLCHQLFTDKEFLEKAMPYIQKEAQRLRLKHFMGIG